MILRNLSLFVLILFLINAAAMGQQKSARNPVIFADVPDMSMIRVEDTYYMSSTTMHMSPGVPIMKSKDLVNWEIVNYAYNILGDVDALNLNNGRNAYGRGSWASCIRYHNGTFYVSTFSSTTGKTNIWSAPNQEELSRFRVSRLHRDPFILRQNAISGSLPMLLISFTAWMAKPGYP